MKRKNYSLAVAGLAAIMAFSGSYFTAYAEEQKTEVQDQQGAEQDAKAVFDLYKDTLREAFSYLEEAANLGCSRAPLTLAQSYNWGIGVTEDYEKALNMFLELTENGSEKAPRYIAMMYENGRGVGVDYAKVAEYYQLAAERGDITSQYYIGRCYEYGIGVDVDYAKAMEWYQQGASCEDSLGTDAMRAIAGLYRDGKGVEQSQELAEEWDAKADNAPEHMPPHALEVAQAEENGEPDTEEPDPGDAMYEQYKDTINKATEYLMEAYELGSDQAPLCVAQAYYYGIGVSEDYQKAMDMFTEIVENGSNVKAGRYVAMMYENGRGVGVNYEKVPQYYQIAAESGDTTSQYYVGKCYEYGIGVDVDYEKAMEWYQLGAACGDSLGVDCMRGIGHLYEEGNGVEQSQELAEEWYEKAANAPEHVPANAKKQEAAEGIQNVITISHIYGDGQKISHIALEFDAAIDPDSLTTESFEVKDRTVTAVHTNSEPAETAENVEGNYVILDLEIRSPLVKDSEVSDGRMIENTDAVIEKATVVQKQDICKLDGTTIAASDKEYSTSAGPGGIGKNPAIKTPELDKFETDHYFSDLETHSTLHYDIFKPEGYEESGEAYPLVLFIADASVAGKGTKYAVQQGNGATCWIADEWQEENPCFVVTIAYDEIFINDYWEYMEETVLATMNLVRSLKDEYPIDSNRIYTTGQSLGCMTSMLMMEKDPDLFAAAYLMAGQWVPEEIKDLKDKNILFLYSEDDGYSWLQAEDVAMWESEGGVVAKASINGIADQETLEAELGSLFAQDANIYNLVIQTGTGSMDAEGNALKGSHRMTWRLGYSLPCVKEWLFAQSK